MWLHSYSPTSEVNHTNYLKISVKKLNSRIGVVENPISFMEDKAKKFPQNIVWKDYIYIYCETWKEGCLPVYEVQKLIRHARHSEIPGKHL